MPLSSTVRLAVLLATLVRSDISLSVGDAGIELSSNTSRNLSKDDSTGTDQPPGSTTHFEDPDKDFIIVENRLNIKCYEKKNTQPGGGSFVEMSRASDRKKKISRARRTATKTEVPNEACEQCKQEKGGDENAEYDCFKEGRCPNPDGKGEEDEEDDQLGNNVLGDEDSGLDDEDAHGDEDDGPDDGQRQQFPPPNGEVVDAVADVGSGGPTVKSPKLPNPPTASCPNHEKTRGCESDTDPGCDEVDCDALTQPPSFLYTVSCEQNKEDVDNLIVEARKKIAQAEAAIAAVQGEQKKLDDLIEAEKVKADGSVKGLEAITAALEALIGKAEHDDGSGVETFIKAIAADEIFKDPEGRD